MEYVRQRVIKDFDNVLFLQTFSRLNDLKSAIENPSDYLERTMTIL
jgi:hypothetical protein